MKFQDFLVGLGVLTLGVAAYLKPVSVDEIVDGSARVEQSTTNSELHRSSLANFPEYNSLLPVLEKESSASGVPLEFLAVICLNESKGKGGVRHEPAFQKRYIDNKFGGKPNVYTKLCDELNVDVDNFKRQLSSSTGPMQVMYATAVDLGFRGSFDELSLPENNIKFAARLLQKKGVDRNTSLETALKIFNTGSAKGTPHNGYLERAKGYCEKLGVPYG